jgi:hypothetical protein
MSRFIPGEGARLSKEEIIHEISSYMDEQGGFPYEWYVGIAEDARDSLFEAHNVDWERGRWIYQPANSPSEARLIEEHFLIVVGTDGGDGDGRPRALQVYAYRKSYRTTP